MDRPAINILSLCSGVGMLDEGVIAGLEYLGLRGRVACYCEWESYAQAVLLARMEDSSLEPAPICSDMADIDGRFRGLVDIVVAGFSCQPWSVAGAQRGIEDDRWVWPDIFRIIRDVEPRIVFLENVPGLVSGGGLEYVLSDLAKVGFDAQWTCLTAAAVGAPHKRERVFILGYSQGIGISGNLFFGRRQGEGIPVAERRNGDVADTLRLSGGERAGRQRVFNGGANVADTSGAGRRLLAGSDGRASGTSEGEIRSGRVRRQQRATVDEQPGQPDGSGEPLDEPCDRDGGIQPLFPPGPGDRDGWLRILESQPWLAPAVESGFRLPASRLALVVDDCRADQLRCSGNGVVALQAAAAFVELLRRASLI